MGRSQKGEAPGSQDGEFSVVLALVATVEENFDDSGWKLRSVVADGPFAGIEVHLVPLPVR